MNQTTFHRIAKALFILSPLFLAWVIGAVGVLGVDGDPGDLMYFSVFAIAIFGAIVFKWEPSGMIKTLIGMIIAQLIVTGFGFMMGYHLAEISSWQELLFLNLFYVVLYGISAWCFYKSQSASVPKPITNGI